MFTGIIETTGIIAALVNEGSNVHITVTSSISGELKVDQSIAHNGVCLTVVKTDGDTHTVTAVDETLKRSTFRYLAVGDSVNLERSMLLNGRLDGHLVQGHVDEVVTCMKVKTLEGSWLYTFGISKKKSSLLVEKGSVCINGVSLTVVKAGRDNFSVAIIPYTYEHTNFRTLKTGDHVNIEYDVIGKYVQRMMKNR